MTRYWGKRINLGDCYELLLYEVHWGAVPSISNGDCTKLFRSAIQEGIDAYVQERRLRLDQNHLKPSPPQFFPMFGEYDYILFRPNYTARSFYYSWPPSAGDMKDKFHTRRYIYQEVMIAKLGWEPGYFQRKLEKAEGKCFAFVHVECPWGTHKKFLGKLARRLNKKGAIEDAYVIGILESTAWDAYLICFDLRSGIGDLRKVFQLLMSMQNRKWFLRSVTHLSYKPDAEGKLSAPISVAAGGPLRALTTITYPPHVRSIQRILSKVTQIVRDSQIGILHCGIGQSDAIIDWEIDKIGDVVKMQKVISDLIGLRLLGDCSTTFMEESAL